jgi:electron transfer flavoprotein beta subunit
MLHVCVCVKQTPESASVYIDPITEQIDVERFVEVLNPADACAVEAAVRLKEQAGGTIKVLTIGPKDAEGALRAALAIGADSALRLWNSQAAAWGPFTVAAALAAYFQHEPPTPYTGRVFHERAGGGVAGDHKGPPFPTPPPSPACWINPHSTTDDDVSNNPTPVRPPAPDLILCGDASSDWSSGIVGPALAEQLALPQMTGVAQLELLKERNPLTIRVTRKLERGYRELLEAELPLLITVTSELNEPRYPSLPAHLAALKAHIPVLDPQAFMGDTWLDGLDEMALLEIHTPRPRPRRIAAPDSGHSAYQRIGEIIAGGAAGRQTRLIEGSPEELAKALAEFLQAKGFV